MGNTCNNQESSVGGRKLNSTTVALETSVDESDENGREHLGIRLLRVAVLAACYFLLEIVVKAVTALQFIYVAWKKRPHAGMRSIGEMIAKYMESMWLYCTFASDDAPWPFSPWPRSDQGK